MATEETEMVVTTTTEIVVATTTTAHHIATTIEITMTVDTIKRDLSPEEETAREIDILVTETITTNPTSPIEEEKVIGTKTEAILSIVD